MYIIKESKQVKLAENVPLKDGVYEGYFYGYTLEINEEKYPTLFGVKCTKQFCGGLKNFIIKENCAYME